MASVIPVAGCTAPGAPNECVEDLKLMEEVGRERRAEIIRGYPVEKQWRLYLCQYSVEGGGFEVASVIAEGGDKSITFLLQTLQDGSPRRTGDVLHILGLMSHSGALRGRRDVAEQAERAVSAMQDGADKERALRSLESIKAGV